MQRNRYPVVARADLEAGPADDPGDRVVDRDEQAVFARDFHWLVMYGALGIAAALLFSPVLVGRLMVASAEVNAFLDERRARGHRD